MKLQEPTIFVSVSRTWGQELVSEQTRKRVTLEDCARGYWTLNPWGKAAKVKWLMAVSRNEIVGVWAIDKRKGTNGWMESPLSPKVSWPEDIVEGRTRYACELKSLPKEISGEYCGRTMNDLGLKPMRGPFRCVL